jgi:hypothetical protein
LLQHGWRLVPSSRGTGGQEMLPGMIPGDVIF